MAWYINNLTESVRGKFVGVPMKYLLDENIVLEFRCDDLVDLNLRIDEK